MATKIPVMIKLKSVEFELNGQRLRAHLDGTLEHWTGKGWKRYSDKPHYHHGYIITKIRGKNLRRHRIIYHAFNQSWDIWDTSRDNSIDHIDGNKVNNSLSNLRLATNGQNGHNTGAQSNNKSGHKNICTTYDKNRDSWFWNIEVMCNGKIHKKRFKAGDGPVPEVLPPVPDHVISHAKLMREQLHGDFCNHG